jgi:N-acetylmuramoyl-L-alanine amidase
MIIENNKLVSDDSIKILQKPSPNIGGHFKQGFLDTIVIHYTAGRNAIQSVNSLCNPAHQASAHIVIGRDETITQLVDFDKVAWHAGKSSYNGRIGYNQYSIGIEIDNCGYLTKHADDFLSWFGATYETSDAFEGKHRNPKVNYEYWLRYTEWQIQIVEDICELLIAQYNIKNILGHEEIAPNRKIDPGPAFPLDKLRDKLLNSDRSSDEGDDEDNKIVEVSNNFKTGIVTCGKLNIRADSDINSAKVASPLTKGTIVKIIDEKSDWYYVIANVTGWVSKQYILLNN